MRFAYDTKTVAGVKRYRAFMEDAADLVVRYGGSLSGEHGDGQARGELLPKMFGADLMAAFREFKRIWDPDWRMNPGKIVDAYPLDSNLRLGPDYHPRAVTTHFQFPDDHGSMAAATERCFGVGLCRRLDAGTMCPSFKATRDEMHTTRGRAHLLFEMLRGDALRDGWRDEHVKEALDLCLACKGCKSDCPVSVDIATYKAEFLSHYYEGRLRPLRAYALGLVTEWARLASHAPGLANVFTQTPAFARPVQALLGLAAERKLPPFAPPPSRRGSSAGPGSTAAARRSCSGPTPSRITFTRRSPRPRQRCSRQPGTGSWSPRPASAAVARSMTTGCWTVRRGDSSTCWGRCDPQFGPAFPLSASSRAAPRCSATSCSACCRTTRTRGA